MWNMTFVLIVRLAWGDQGSNKAFHDDIIDPVDYCSLSKLVIHNRLICTRTGISKYRILCTSLFPLDKEEISLVNNSAPQESSFKTILSYCQLPAHSCSEHMQVRRAEIY